MKCPGHRIILVLVLLAAAAAFPGAPVAAAGNAIAPATADAASTPACGASSDQLVLPVVEAPLLQAWPAEPSASGGSCTRCAYNGQSCWCNPCPSICESCPEGGIGGVCFFGTCQTTCAIG